MLLGYLGVDRDAELDEGEHGEVHEDALDQQRCLVVLTKPEQDPSQKENITCFINVDKIKQYNI